MAIDLTRRRGRQLARGLIAGSDVVIENFRPGVMDRLGLGHAELQEADPALIFVSISAYGSQGPSSTRPGFDPILQAESGMMALTGEVDGGPMRHPLSIIDTLTAAHATSAICAALHGRQRHGRGDFIDLCLLDTAISALGNVGMQYLTDGRVPERSGNRHVVGAPIDLFATATEPIYLAMATDRLFRDFCRVIGRPDLVDDERFATPAGRSRNRDALKVEIEAALTTRPADEWLAEMRPPAGRRCAHDRPRVAGSGGARPRDGALRRRGRPPARPARDAVQVRRQRPGGRSDRHRCSVSTPTRSSPRCWR